MIFYIISVLKHSLITATLKPPDPNLPIGPFRPFNTFGMLLLDLEPKIFPGTYTTLVKMVKKCMVVQYLYLVQWMVNWFAEKILLHWNIFQIYIFWCGLYMIFNTPKSRFNESHDLVNKCQLSLFSFYSPRCFSFFDTVVTFAY